MSRYEDLIVWRLAHELQRGVFALTATGAASRDFKFRDQVRDSSASVTRNIAEGFGRFADGEFAWFLRVARGSLMETHNSLRDGQDRGYFTSSDCIRLQRLALRAVKAARLDLLPGPAGGERASRPRRETTPANLADRVDLADREDPVDPLDPVDLMDLLDPMDPLAPYVVFIKALTSSTTCCGVSIIRL